MARDLRLDLSPLHLLHRVRQRASELFQTEMEGIDLTARQYVILVAASCKDGLNQQDIIDSTGIDRSTVSQVVQTMTRKGLLKRRRTREDARAYAITLTDHGRDVLKASDPIVGRIDEALVAALPSARASAFLESLRAIADAAPTLKRVRSSRNGAAEEAAKE
jgi:DNA-binding MarR family transcriptional regulator